MPKVNWAKVKPKVNYLAALFSAYQKACGMTQEQVAKKVGCSVPNVSIQIGKDVDLWTIGQIRKYCAALNVPLQEALEAAGKSAGK